MFRERKEYRKNLTSSGKLHLAGETLDFISHDVSVNGILIEIVPGRLLSTFSDFESFINENSAAEIFVKDLMLTGEVEIIWVKEKDNNILMGLEFKHVIYNADRLWLKRQYYRKKQSFVGFLMLKNKRVEFEGKNISVDGLMIYVKDPDKDLLPNVVVSLYSESLQMKGMAKICWIQHEQEPEKNGALIGLRYLSSE
ncbi:PilZ domain-containing protein [Methylotuvimicrobium sp. KM1]|uniref:PilZ domain-containing protein n=1 Tax=Methylotuvimicrobium sp. KM1 TaxID=3377707 RepID=UPI00384B86D2